MKTMEERSGLTSARVYKDKALDKYKFFGQLFAMIESFRNTTTLRR